MSNFYGKEYSIASLLDAGVHYGHRKNYWNPKMSEYIYGIKSNVHIIDLRKTVQNMEKALSFLQNIAAKNGRVLFVSTKKQAFESIASEAIRCGQYYVNYRWLGGMLTNWKTISNSINTLTKYEKMLQDTESQYTKKEKLNLERKRKKLDLVLCGIRSMGGLPNALFVVGVRENFCAIQEAKRLNIPVIAIADTNCDPNPLDFPIPGNDDSRKAIELYTRLAAEAVLSGIRKAVEKEEGAKATKLQSISKPTSNDSNSQKDKTKIDKKTEVDTTGNAVTNTEIKTDTNIEENVETNANEKAENIKGEKEIGKEEKINKAKTDKTENKETTLIKENIQKKHKTNVNTKEKTKEKEQQKPKALKEKPIEKQQKSEKETSNNTQSTKEEKTAVQS